MFPAFLCDGAIHLSSNQMVFVQQDIGFIAVWMTCTQTVTQ